MESLFLKSIVLGGMDGIVTTLNRVSAAVGLKLGLYYVIIISLTSLIADAMSMGVGDYLSYDAQRKQEGDKYEKSNPLYHGLVTFTAFIVFGSIPLVLFLFLNKYYKNQLYTLLIIVMTIAFFILGAVRSQFTHEVWWETGIKTALYGDATSIAAYLISDKLSDLLISLKK
jgi:VIT1/CCC1 family predicted Fe2+/Mn2+ transporter